MKSWIVMASTALLSLHAAACPLTDWLTQRYGVSFSGFEHPIPEAAAPVLDRVASVRVAFPDNAAVADGFRHAVVLDVSTGKAWILRTGGFIGVRQWYGPVEVPAMSMDTCRTEPAERRAPARLTAQALGGGT